MSEPAGGTTEPAPPEAYTHGHHESVLRAHRWRTAENSAGYLLDDLRPGQRLLDVGCGPGTITLDLAARVAPGQVLGIDASPDVIAEAEVTRQEAGAANVAFATGDVYRLDAEDGSFDVVHAHQVLQHLADPVAGLVEMRRVLRPGGILAVRDADYGAFVWGPADPRLDRWLELYHQLTVRNGVEADAGRNLLTWVRRAGFSDVRASSSTWTFADPDSREWWGGGWAERVLASSFAEQAVDYGLSDRTELNGLAEGWRHWAAQDDGLFIVVHGEILARR
jgi:ubiquinone/menaquinone biosynthesis C-methylase UbiE